VCGIAGIIKKDVGAAVDAEVLRRMCRTMVHRGPDDEGIYVKGAVGLGMRRLAIIDLSTGHQPLSNEDETVWVVLNGEIYNFQELRTELERAGHHFRTHSDTEVICHLYEEHGETCVEKLRGMFAFALYDERKRLLLLARDRMGEKPLHYAQTNGSFVFGSEIKALLAAAPELRELKLENLHYYFQFGYIPDPHSVFTNIQKLPPGHSLVFTDGQIRIRRYWDLPRYGTATLISEEECLEELERRLAEAVRLQMISDVPLGALLSGGVDSSTVVAFMARASSRPIKTFSIGFRHADFNELQYARAVAERFGTEHHELYVDSSKGDTLETLTHILEEPFADNSALPTYQVCALARQHVTVALNGDGGDELFAGYDRYEQNVNGNALNGFPQWMGRFYREHLYPHLPAAISGRNYVYNATLSPRERYLDSVTHLPAWGRERLLFSADFISLAGDGAQAPELFRQYYDTALAQDPLSRLQYLDAKTNLPFQLLTKVDRMSMACSLETRVPILDHCFVEWVTSLPAHWKLNGNTKKYIFKKLAERVGVPRHVLHRPKQGFALPLVHWMRQEMKGELIRVLMEPRTLQRGYFNPQSVKKLLDEHVSGRRDRSGQLWVLLMLELWHRNFLECPDGYTRLPIYAREILACSREGQRQPSEAACPSPTAVGESLP
jgi:asparagine synthase (glutamine-hydrolysing)